MPRIDRHTVEFTVDGIQLRAHFSHQHAEEHRRLEELPVYREVYREAELVEEVTGGTLGSQKVTRRKVLIAEQKRIRTDWDHAIKTPLTWTNGENIEKLRHITTCTLSAADGKGGWQQLGVGVSRCSAKDKYNWRKGIKAALLNAISDTKIEKAGPVLGAFYAELPRKLAAEPEEDITIG